MSTLNNTRIKVSKDEIGFRVETSGGDPTPFQRDKLTMEFSIARIFHRVLNAYRLSETEIFEETDFEILGGTLGKILFENNESGESRKDLNALLRTFRNAFQDPDCRCRVYLEFSADAGIVAMLPWEYLRLKLEIQDKPTYYTYLAADRDAKFDLIRSFPGIENFKIPAPVKKLHVILVKANCNGPFNVDESKVLDKWSSDLIKNNNAEIVFHPLLQPADKMDANTGEHAFVASLKEILKDIDEPYVIHYLGHGLVKAGIGFLSFVSDNGDAAWIEDKKFAAFFDSNKFRKPHLISLQACSSGQIPRFKEKEQGEREDEMRGVALNLCLKEIPAVVSMQNDITEQDSFAFFAKFYQALLDGDDIAEAVTKGRTFLGCTYKKAFVPGERNAPPDYNNNIFGAPVLFISTEHPFRFKEKKSKSAAPESVYKLCMRCDEVLQNYRGDIHSVGGCNGMLISISEQAAKERLDSQEEKRKPQNFGAGIQTPAATGAPDSFNQASNASARDNKAV